MIRNTLLSVIVYSTVLLAVCTPEIAEAAGRATIGQALGGKARVVADDGGDKASFLTIGTMYGLSYSSSEYPEYYVRDGIVFRSEVTFSDRLRRSVYAFPSINLFGIAGKSLSLIVPLNVTDVGNTYGFGFSWGFKVHKRGDKGVAEIGLALIVIWTDVDDLDPEQKESLDSGTPLPVGHRTDFGDKAKPSFGIGIYVAPWL